MSFPSMNGSDGGEGPLRYRTRTSALTVNYTAVRETRQRTDGSVLPGTARRSMMLAKDNSLVSPDVRASSPPDRIGLVGQNGV